MSFVLFATIIFRETRMIIPKSGIHYHQLFIDTGR